MYKRIMKEHLGWIAIEDVSVKRLPAWVSISLLLWLASPSLADEAYPLMLKWLDLESQKGKLQSEWSNRESLLKRRLQLLDIEKQALEQLLSQSRSSTDAIDSRRQSLLQSQQTLEQEQALLEQQLAAAIEKAELLQIRLPPPLQTEWSEMLVAAKRDGGTHSQILERLLSMYTLLDTFNGRVALHRAPLRIGDAGDAAQVMVSQIYLGVAQGWYVSDDGQHFGYGRPTARGWQWWHGDQASQLLGRELQPQTLLDVRAMIKSPTDATFVPLPVLIGEG